MTPVTEGAFAKLNLSLDVRGKRPDGWHEMLMVMQSVALEDEVTVALRDDGAVRAVCNLSWLPCDGRNLAVRAAQAFLSERGPAGAGADIRLKKRIPVGAGMAGGSADAAAVLRALNRLTGAGLSREALCAMALPLGSDVPYCIAGGTALAQGQGELLTPLPPLPPCDILVCKPPFPISTASLFALVDARSSRVRPDTPGLVEALERGELAGVARRMYNVFEDVLPRGCGEVRRIRLRLLELGALGAVMTGTGSAVFGLFGDPAAAEAAHGVLKKEYRDCFLTKAIPALEV